MFGVKVVRQGERVAVWDTAGRIRFVEGPKRVLTIRKTIDVMIATFCVHNGLPLLHSDRDFDAMAAHIGLRTL